MIQEELQNEISNCLVDMINAAYLSPTYLLTGRASDSYETKLLKIMELITSYTEKAVGDALEKAILKLSVETDCEVCMENQEILNDELQSNKGMEG